MDGLAAAGRGGRSDCETTALAVVDEVVVVVVKFFVTW